jgi:arylsulfatase A-like enzyme
MASLLTGLYPSVHKTTTSSVPFPEAMSGHPSTMPMETDVLPASLTTLAEALRTAGYRTIGMTGNPFLSEPFGFDQGFEQFSFFPGTDFVAGERLVDAALAAAERAGPGPMFLWVHLMEPHSPYAPPSWTDGMFALNGPYRPIAPEVDIPGWLVPGRPRDLREYEIRYDEDIAAADVDVGVLLRELARLRDPSNTVVVLTSDHGEEFLDHGGWEHGSSLHDELVRVPLVVKAPNVRARVVRSQLELTDVYGIVLAFADPRLGAIDGAAWLDELEGTDRPAFSELVDAQWAVRWWGWKLIRHADGREELFDLEHDPAERVNVAAAEPTRLADLRRLLNGIRRDAASRGVNVHRERRVPPPSLLRRLRSLGYTSG